MLPKEPHFLPESSKVFIDYKNILQKQGDSHSIKGTFWHSV